MFEGAGWVEILLEVWEPLAHSSLPSATAITIENMARAALYTCLPSTCERTDVGAGNTPLRYHRGEIGFVHLFRAKVRITLKLIKTWYFQLVPCIEDTGKNS